MTQATFTQEPVAIIGMACRLPGGCNSPKALWDFLEQGGIADTTVPDTRFNLKGHYDGSAKAGTMRPPGGLFLKDVDVADFDASFFEISRAEAISMDPNQRQLLEVVYEGLENAGVSLQSLDGAPVGCFIGSYAVDYHDMQSRDPEDRPASIEVGIGRAILSNRISHFLNIKGPSVTVDTACSGSLVGLDIACRYLHSREITSAIVAASNLYLSPEHVMDTGPIRMAHSPTGQCHTFDAAADGYIKAEAVNAVILKRLDDALRDGDPIRAIIRGSSTNSDGRTPGIASPSPTAQAAAVRAAYANAAITDLSLTGYVECHGTGTQAGDPLEVQGVSSVFSKSRSPDEPLIIGSVKSNLGHSEPAAGLSGLLKAVLALESGIIPGNPTFVTPSPKIDFSNLRVRATRSAIPWPDKPIKRASINSFGYGGTNSHVIVDSLSSLSSKTEPSHVSSYLSIDDELYDDDESDEPYALVLSANDEAALKSYCNALDQHLSSPSVKVKLSDLAYTLSEKRTHHFHRAYAVVKSTALENYTFNFGKKSSETPKIGFVFTGQGAQWPQMGKAVIETFPCAKARIAELDAALQQLPNPPSWSLLDELVEPRSPEHLREPEFSQPLVTALQLAILAVFEQWGISAQAVVGHSSGEIAAAYAAGLLSKEDAIKVAFYRGQSAKLCKRGDTTPVGMLAVGLGADSVLPYLQAADGQAQIACFNSPKSVTLSGAVSALNAIKDSLVKDGHFARALQVDLAYHSKFMAEIGREYLNLLHRNFKHLEPKSTSTTMFSSVTGKKLEEATDAEYWEANMVSPVRFSEAVKDMASNKDAPDFLIEIGPSGALAGPISQIKEDLGAQGNKIQYTKALTRGQDAVLAMFEVAGKLFVAGGAISMSQVNRGLGELSPSVIVDLPNYQWNHSTKYWHESDSSKDWRFRPFPHHDLLGSKVLGSPWDAPSFRKNLRLEHLPWIRDHKMGSDILMPASGFIAMAIEALYQTSQMVSPREDVSSASQLSYRLRNVKFDKALVLEENAESKIMFRLTPEPGTNSPWYNFSVASSQEGSWATHCSGLIRLEEHDVTEIASQDVLAPLKHTTPGGQWYKALNDIGYGFGPEFQKQIEVESLAGTRASRSIVSLKEPESLHSPQSPYPMHPACIDGCFQTSQPSLWAGDRSNVSAVVVPASIDSLVISPVDKKSPTGVSVGYSEYTGRGRQEEAKNYWSDCSVYDPETGRPLLKLSGLRYHKLDVGIDPRAKHTLSRVQWRPDITFMSPDQILGIADASNAAVQDVIDLVMHKSPIAKVLEVCVGPDHPGSLWFEGGDEKARAAYSQYTFVSADAKVIVDVQSTYSGFRRTAFELHDFTKGTLNSDEANFDFAIVKLSSFKEHLAQVSQNLITSLAEGALVCFVELDSSSSSDSDHSGYAMVDDTSSVGSASSQTKLDGFANVTELSTHNGERLYFASVAPSAKLPDRKVNIAHLRPASRFSKGLKSILQRNGWQTTEHTSPFSTLDRTSPVLVLDELSSPLLNSVSETQWANIKELITSGSKILWVTQGSQMTVSSPDKALVHGMFRTIRAEDPGCRLTTLDVEYSESPSSYEAIESTLQFLLKPIPKMRIESEFVERGGIVYVSRVLADEPVNAVMKSGVMGGEPVMKSLESIKPVAMLRAERLGTLDALCYSEMSAKEIAVQEGMIEVDIHAASLNFKDVAVTMGIVPENEHLLGLEGAGVVRRVGKGAGRFKVGDRVAILRNGTFANRIQCPVERTHHIPDSLSFEEASTIPLVYLTSLYSLFNVGGLSEGKSVLIHSAAGGVGLSCIQLAQWAKAEIYVTVGTEEKSKYLQEKYGISKERIFSSRNTKFAASIMAETKGRGIDVIINSLVGELLDESWRICADGGVMVEIGKKDIVDRNHLSMEPFDRNCSFRAVDFSYKQITNTVIESLLSQTFSLLQEGHIKAINPITKYSFANIPEAFAFMRSGKHLGKIVITNAGEAVQVPVRPAVRKLRLLPERSYMIVGGLKGLCGSLAIFLAKQGAKNIIAMSRSGCSDPRSQKIVANCASLGCSVQEAKVDVSNPSQVLGAFKDAKFPVAGVIQGAMVLRDRPYESMTVDDFHTTISNKVQGTWNLHHAAGAQEQPLDFFTLLSSISGVIGQKGQANYSAANVFLDSFASYRHSLGLVAHSLDLGVIEDVGYVAEQGGMTKHFDDKQWTGINESFLHDILSYSIFQQMDVINKNSAAQMITGIPLPQPPESELARDARFMPLFISDSGSSGGQGGSGVEKNIQAFFLLRQSGADAAAVLEAAVELVGAQFTKTLRLSDPIEPGKSLSTYGLDSLSAVEFRNWVRVELGAEITVLEVAGATSLFALCEKIIAKLPALT